MTHITFGVYVLSYTLYIVLLFLSYHSHENFVCSMCLYYFEIIIQRAKVLIEIPFVFVIYYYINTHSIYLSLCFSLIPNVCECLSLTNALIYIINIMCYLLFNNILYTNINSKPITSRTIIIKHNKYPQFFWNTQFKFKLIQNKFASFSDYYTSMLILNCDVMFST